MSAEPLTAKQSFRDHLPDLNTPRFQTAKQQSPYEYTQAFRDTHFPPWLYNLTEAWKDLLAEPFRGVTNDGTVRSNLYKLHSDGCNVDSIVQAANDVISKATSSEQHQKLSYPMNAQEWRCWSNPEFLLRPFGLRLEELSDELVASILRVIEASFSIEGYRKACAAMEINHFLGEVCDVPRIMNRRSYNFLLFGTPSVSESWGWSLYGHHLCLSVFIKAGHISITPTFTGAEPNEIDAGQHAGTAILHKEGDLGLALMQSLSEEQQRTAQIYKQLKDPAMLQTGDLKVDRWNKDDQRHVCGAFRDNRVVPYEGVLVGKLTDKQQTRILEIVEQFVLYLPDTARRRRLEEVRKHFGETYFCWIGGFGSEDAYYFRIQSPVIVCEFDHHSGVFLTNETPAKFHTHTICRAPNGGDYGNALRSRDEQVP